MHDIIANIADTDYAAMRCRRMFSSLMASAANLRMPSDSLSVAIWSSFSIQRNFFSSISTFSVSETFFATQSTSNHCSQSVRKYYLLQVLSLHISFTFTKSEFARFQLIIVCVYLKESWSVCNHCISWKADVLYKIYSCSLFFGIHIEWQKRHWGLLS